jgi:hypothetical protein
LSKKEKQLAKMLDIPLSKYGHMFASTNNSKPRRDCKWFKF